MAERLSVNDPIRSVCFKDIREHIRSSFDSLLKAVVERRDQLLTELNHMESEYLKKEESREKQVKEFAKMLERTGEINAQEDSVLEVKLNHISTILGKMEMCEQLTPVPLVVFKAGDLNPCLEQLGKIGVIESSSIYSVKEKPVSSVRKGELDRPFGICLDQDETIYVCDCGNSRIQVFSKDGEFLSEFGKEQLFRPHGIAVSDKWVFIVDWGLNAMFKFQKADFKIVKKNVELGLQNPKDLALDRNNNVLVADCGNHKIAVLNSELEFEREIGKGKLKYPCGIQIYMKKIFVVGYNKPNNVHVFSQAGDMLHNMINLKISTSMIGKNFGRHHIFICFDKFGNIIISATEDKSIQIYTLEGNLLHSIKCEGYPTGIAAKNDDTIVCTVYDPSCIKFY